MDIDLFEYKSGGRVLYIKDNMNHKISLHLDQRKIDLIPVEKNISGLPLNVNNMFSEKPPEVKKAQSYEKYQKLNEKKWLSRFLPS